MTKFPLVACAILLQVVCVGCHRAWEDVTETRYNGYQRSAVYRLLKPMQLVHDTATGVPSNYRIDSHFPPESPWVDGELPVGTRVRFEKAVWAPSHEGSGNPIAYGRLLDPPFASRLVNLVLVSDRPDLVGRAQPDTNVLALESRLR